jgi:uncharacterized small protein (TIGR04563 family)
VIDKRKQSVYLPEDVLEVVRLEARRQDRSLSWILQAAVRIARPKLATLPGVPDFGVKP